MGYDTWYSGSFVVTPPIPEDLAHEVWGGSFAPWELSPDRDVILAPDDSPRVYADEAEAALYELIMEKLKARGHTITGNANHDSNENRHDFGMWLMRDGALFYMLGIESYEAPVRVRAAKEKADG